MFLQELTQLINKHSKENGSNTPDFILADFLSSCLDALDKANRQRQEWYENNKLDKFCECLLILAENHYWDSLTEDKNIVLAHLKSLIGMVKNSNFEQS